MPKSTESGSGLSNGGSNDNESKSEGNSKGKTVVPPHNMHLARRLNVVKCRIDLYKVPPKYIKFEPTATHLHLDTLDFTKKYYLNLPYPEGVTVDTNVEATFDSGVLKCDFPIIRDPNKPADHDKVVEARSMVTDMRKKGIAIPMDLEEAAKLAKDKSKDKEKAQAPEGQVDKEKEKAIKKKKKALLSNKEKRQKEKAKRALDNGGDEANDPTTTRKSKKAKVQNDGSKKKTFLDDPSEALQLADKVNEQQELEMQAKMDKEYAKLSFETRKKIERKEQQAHTRALRKEEADKAIQKFPTKRKEKKKTSTKVSFAE